MDWIKVLASKTIARGTDRRDDVHHGQQSAKQEHSGSASALKETEHWQVHDARFSVDGYFATLVRSACLPERFAVLAVNLTYSRRVSRLCAAKAVGVAWKRIEN
jgi:hypothetical protein